MFIHNLCIITPQFPHNPPHNLLPIPAENQRRYGHFYTEKAHLFSVIRALLGMLQQVLNAAPQCPR